MISSGQAASAKAYLGASSGQLTESPNQNSVDRPLSKHIRLARDFESRFGCRCKEAGREAIWQGHESPFDYLVDGWRIELKVALPQKAKYGPFWKFNIHRHNALKENKVDFYVLRLQDVPFTRYDLHLLLKAPLKKKVLQFSVRSLMDGYGLYGREYHRFMRGEFGQGPHPLPEAQS